MSRTHKDSRRHIERLAKRFDCPELLDLCEDEKPCRRPRFRWRKTVKKEAERLGIKTLNGKHFQYSW